jgi:hypothetical protein
VRRDLLRYSPRSSTRWSQSNLQSIPGRNSDCIAGCNSARNLGRNLTRYPARNRTSSCRRCSRSSGRSGGGSGRTSSPRRSPGSSSGRDLGSNADSNGGGIGGGGKGIGVRGLGIGKLGQESAVGGICAIPHIAGSWMSSNSCHPRGVGRLLCHGASVAVTRGASAPLSSRLALQS